MFRFGTPQKRQVTRPGTVNPLQPQKERAAGAPMQHQPGKTNIFGKNFDGSGSVWPEFS
jgi:hypothetical protein